MNTPSKYLSSTQRSTAKKCLRNPIRSVTKTTETFSMFPPAKVKQALFQPSPQKSAEEKEFSEISSINQPTTSHCEKGSLHQLNCLTPDQSRKQPISAADNVHYKQMIANGKKGKFKNNICLTGLGELVFVCSHEQNISYFSIIFEIFK